MGDIIDLYEMVKEVKEENEEFRERIQQLEDKMYEDENQTGLHTEKEEDEEEDLIN